MWFLIERASPGSASPVTPVFEKNGKWLSYEKGEEAPWGFYVLRTEVATPTTTKVRDVLIVWRPDNTEPQYPESEEAAKSNTRWVVMVVETVDPSAGTFTIQGRPDFAVSIATARKVVETKKVPKPQ